MVSALLLLRALEKTQTTPPLSLGIVLAADEETGNKSGMEYILEHHGHFFGSDDLIVIPDFGTPGGGRHRGREKACSGCHSQSKANSVTRPHRTRASIPLTACADLILDLERLSQRFDQRDPLFTPPVSTFVPTKKEANASPIGTPLPGQDVFSWNTACCPSMNWMRSKP